MGALKNINHEKFAVLVAGGQQFAEAYREVYPRSNNWQENSVWVNASKLAANTKLKLRIDELKEKYDRQMSDKLEITLEQVLGEMAQWLMVDPADVFSDGNTIGDVRDLPKSVRMSIAGFKVSALYDYDDDGNGKRKKRVGDVYDIKFVDKRATAEMFMKKFGAYIENKMQLELDLSHLDDIVKKIKVTKSVKNA